MNEVLEKLLSSELLTEETMQEISTALNEELEKVKAEAKEQAMTEAKAEFATQFVEEKERLIESLDTKFTALFNEEMDELKESIERFRDLEAEHAAQLVEEKEKMALQLQADLTQLTEALDVFLEQQLEREFVELKESIEEVKKIEFARKLYESIEDTFKTRFFDETGLDKKLEEAKSEAKQSKAELLEAQNKLNKLVREQELNRVLESLHGNPRKIMEAILKSVPTNKLDEAYDNYIGRVLHDSTKLVENESEKNGKTPSALTENTSTESTTPETIVTGDLQESVQIKQSAIDASEKARMRMMAGILD